MSDYRNYLTDLMEKQIISGCIILDPSGNFWWHTGVFPKVSQAKNPYVDGYYLLSEWVTYPYAVHVAGVEYFTLDNSYPDHWCLKNLTGHGSIILQRCKNGYFFVCYSSKEHDPLEVQRHVRILAEMFG